MKTYSWKYRIALAPVVGVLLGAFLTRGGTLPPEAQARAVCRGAILKTLKKPESAEFGQYSVTQTPSGEWRVFREFSAENGAGVRLTSARLCVLEKLPDGFRLARLSQP